MTLKSQNQQKTNEKSPLSSGKAASNNKCNEGEQQDPHVPVNHVEGDDSTPCNPTNKYHSFSVASSDSNEDESEPLATMEDGDGGDHDDDNGDHRHGPPTKTMARILLFIVSFLYGTLNVSLRLVYALDNSPSASVLSTVRGWLATLCFIPIVVLHHNKNGGQPSVLPSSQLPDTTTSESLSTSHIPLPRRERSLWSVSLELACLNFGAQALINISLLFIASARAAFLTETSVVITPLISAMAGHGVKWTVWGACVAAMTGLVILSDTSSKGIGNFSFGDFLVLAGAVCWSTYLFRLSQYGGAYNEVDMQAAKTVLLACLYTLWFALSALTSSVSLWAGYGSVAAWLLLFYSALGPGAVADVIQQKAQASIAAAEANVILAMEPVFTSILGFILLAEALTVQEYLGGAFLIGAAILATR